jgi:hypothetical protein
MNGNEINDKRLITDFKITSFSNYKKSDVKKELLNNLLTGSIESACHWSAELICSGHLNDLWDIIITFVSKNIHLGNPKLPLYIDLRINDFRNIMNSGYSDNELKARNNFKIRKLFAEIICIICLSKKRNAFSSLKIKKDEYDITKISYKLKADGLHYANKIFTKEDPKELFIGVNEFSWNITQKVKDSSTAIYWLEWLLGFEICCTKNKKKNICGRRNMPVHHTMQKDLIWIIWEALLYEAKRNKTIYKITKSLLNIFCFKYSHGIKKKRKFIIYFAISLLTQPIDGNIKLYENKDFINNIVNKINIIYKDLKKNEIKPATDYLFNNNIANTNLEKTISKLDKLSNLNMFIRNK